MQKKKKLTSDWFCVIASHIAYESWVPLFSCTLPPGKCHLKQPVPIFWAKKMCIGLTYSIWNLFTSVAIVPASCILKQVNCTWTSQNPYNFTHTWPNTIYIIGAYRFYVSKRKTVLKEMKTRHDTIICW